MAVYAITGFSDFGMWLYFRAKKWDATVHAVVESTDLADKVPDNSVAKMNKMGNLKFIFWRRVTVFCNRIVKIKKNSAVWQR